jgi:hypothetical protein
MRGDETIGLAAPYPHHHVLRPSERPTGAISPEDPDARTDVWQAYGGLARVHQGQPDDSWSLGSSVFACAREQ